MTPVPLDLNHTTCHTVIMGDLPTSWPVPRTLPKVRQPTPRTAPALTLWHVAGHSAVSGAVGALCFALLALAVWA